MCTDLTELWLWGRNRSHISLSFRTMQEHKPVGFSSWWERDDEIHNKTNNMGSELAQCNHMFCPFDPQRWRIVLHCSNLFQIPVAISLWGNNWWIRLRNKTGEQIRPPASAVNKWLCSFVQTKWTSQSKYESETKENEGFLLDSEATRCPIVRFKRTGQGFRRKWWPNIGLKEGLKEYPGVED